MKFSACGGWFGKDNYQTYREAASHSFAGVEQLGWLGLDLEKAKSIMDEEDIVSTAIVIQSKNPKNMDKIAWSHGMVWEDAEVAFIEAFNETVEAAKILGVPNIIATTGNERSDVSREVQHKNIVNVLKKFAPIAEKEGLMVVLEPLNILVNHMGYYLARSDEAFEIIREVNSPNVKLLFDIYHQQITEGNLINNITKNIDLIGHFHIGDNPGRNEPGTGEINYWNVFSAIEESGYDRWLAFECGRTMEVDDLCSEMWALIAPFSDDGEGCGCGCEDCEMCGEKDDDNEEDGCDCGCKK